MSERHCPLAKPIADILYRYAETKNGGNTSKYVADGLVSHGMTEGLMRFAEVCDSSGQTVAEKMGLGDKMSARDQLAFLHMIAAGPLVFLTLLGDTGKRVSDAVSAIKIKLPQASASAPAVDWFWQGPLDG